MKKLLLFAVIRRSKNLVEGFMDTVEKRFMRFRKVIYVIGGSTDVAYSDEHQDFNDFLRMQKQVCSLVATLQEI